MTPEVFMKKKKSSGDMSREDGLNIAFFYISILEKRHTYLSPVDRVFKNEQGD